MCNLIFVSGVGLILPKEFRRRPRRVEADKFVPDDMRTSYSFNVLLKDRCVDGIQKFKQ